MSVAVKALLAELHPGQAVTFENMTVAPLAGGDLPPAAGGAPEVEYVTLQEAMSSGAAHVEELGGGGSVPDVSLVNEGDLPVIVVDGEEIVGAKQNRMVNATLLVAAKTSLTIPVSCVEAGRWHARTNEFGHAGRIVPHGIRAMNSRAVHESLREGRGCRSDQGEVWDAVRGVHERLGTHSPTESLSDACDARSRDVEQYLAAFPARPDQTGCAVAVDGRAAGFEVLATPGLYGRLHRQIVASYATQAMISRGRPDARADADALPKLIARAAASRWKRFDAPGTAEQPPSPELLRPVPERVHRSLGEGEQWRARNRRLVGTAVVHGGRVVHLVVAALS